MTTFHDLFRQPTRKVNGSFPPDHRDELFPGMVERSRKLHLWAPGLPTSEHGPRLLIGVAMWSGYDLNLLDLVEEAVHGPVRIDVFDIGVCQSVPEIDAYIPGLGDVPMPPFAGLWNDGRLIEAAAGHPARELICRVCDIPSDEMERRLKTVLTRM